ncbi:hypothetical protein IMSAGC022_00436 [Alistipes sp.]|nr:hypothetical protein IMSAGC022_00436 [Alistipes sp.]
MPDFILKEWNCLMLQVYASDFIFQNGRYRIIVNAD